MPIVLTNYINTNVIVRFVNIDRKRYAKGVQDSNPENGSIFGLSRKMTVFYIIRTVLVRSIGRR